MVSNKTEIRLEEIQTLRSSVIFNSPIKDNIGVHFSHRAALNKMEPNYLFITINLEAEVEPPNKPIVELEVLFKFYFSPAETITVDENKSLIIPDQLLDTFLGLSYSTMRGILYSILQGANYRLILPIIDTKQIRTMSVNKTE